MAAYREHPRSRPFWRSKGFIIGALFAIVAGWGIFSRIEAETTLHKRTEDSAVANVTVLKAPTGNASEEVVLPGNVQAWHEAPIFARTSGYLKDWKTDIGARVKDGEVLAEIETPEVDAQLHQAEADLATAKANTDLANVTAKRWVDLLKTNSVSKQETDEKTGDASAKLAAYNAARANVDRLHQLEGFKKVVAPFAGVVTARNTDTGALINAGSATSNGQELFHVADLHKLRIYVQVPQTYTSLIGPDLKAELRFSEHPGKTYPAKLVQSAHALDPTTRTLLVEFAVDNASGELMPGGYTEAHLRIPAQADSVRLPVNTLIFRRDGLQVATIDADNKAVLKTITVGRDFGKEVEVVAGIAPGEPVIVNPPDSLATGSPVHVNESAPEGDKKEEKK